MAWYKDTPSLMAMVERAKANPDLLPNHREAVLPKLVAKHESNQELIAAFEVEGDQEEVSALRREQTLLEIGIAFYEARS